MAFYTDQMGNDIRLPAVPKRIVSLVPSQTELLADLGLDESVIAITKFCVHPESWFRNKTRIGGTKNVDIEKIKSLQPDLIIANKEENVKEQVDALRDIAPVWVSDVNTLEDALSMIGSVGEITGKKSEAASMVALIQQEFNTLLPADPPLSTVYLIWKDPYMTIGGDTFISDMMRRAGFDNVFGDRERYPEISPEDIHRSQCGIVLLSSEPYPFTQQHIAALKPLLPNQKLVLVDGEIFSWYGSRLRYAPAYLHDLLTKVIQ